MLRWFWIDVEFIKLERLSIFYVTRKCTPWKFACRLRGSVGQLFATHSTSTSPNTLSALTNLYLKHKCNLFSPTQHFFGRPHKRETTMVFYYIKHSLYVPSLPPHPRVRQSSADSEGSTISVDKITKLQTLSPIPPMPRRRSVQFNKSIQMHDDVYEREEPIERWYSATDIRKFLGDSRQETMTTLTSNKKYCRRVQQAYVLYSQGLDTTLNASEGDQKACQAVGLDRLVVHAHLRRHNNERRRKLMKRMDELQDIECPLKRERLLAQASLGISQSAVFAATHLAQWWSTNKNTFLPWIVKERNVPVIISCCVHMWIRHPLVTCKLNIVKCTDIWSKWSP